MNKYDTEKALQDYEAACKYIAEVFVNKQFGNEESEEDITFENSPTKLWWVNDGPGKNLCYGDYVFGFNDILTDLKLNAAPGKIIRYYDYVVQWMNENPTLPMSYSTYLFTEAQP